MKGRKIKILTLFLSLLGVTSCDGPDMYGPPVPDFNDNKLMYGPAPASFEAVIPEMPHIEIDEVADGE